MQRLRKNFFVSKLILLQVGAWIGLSVGTSWAVPANDNFGGATVLDSTSWGSIDDDNTGATGEPNEPSHAGFFPSQSVWYQWTAPQDGEVLWDTLSSTVSANDTVLAVYAGNSLGALNQVAANDDLYPLPQPNFSGQNLMGIDPIFAATNLPVTVPSTPPPPFPNPLAGGLFVFFQPFSGQPGVLLSGSSGVRFNAKAGTTYYIAVDSKSLAAPFTLNWAYHSSGVFRFASENIDQASGVPGMLLYQCSETETSRRISGPVNASQYNTTLHTEYVYDVPGVLVTVTRVAGSSGRVEVDYTTVDGDQLTDAFGGPVALSGDKAAIAGIDYVSTSGTLVFDDFEMSKTILVPIIDDAFSPNRYQPNRDFGIVLSSGSAQKDFFESDEVSNPRIDPVYGRALVRILDVDVDPKGPSVYQQITGGGATTNYVVSLIPTNAVLNFQKANYRVPEDVGNYWGSTPITVYVNRLGTNRDSASVNYRINNFFVSKSAGLDQANNVFPLQPASDYATPTPANAGNTLGINSDFDGSFSGTLTWGANVFDPQPITFSVNNDTLTEFNEDFHIELYSTDTDGNELQMGMVAETTVTILFDDVDAPAGSVDEYHNPDFGLNLVPPANTALAHPGTDADSQVNALIVQANNTTVIGGDFSSFNGVQRHGIARLNLDGSLDTTFDPQDGVSITTGDFISALADANGSILVGGSFNSFNGTACGNFVELNADGSINNSFLLATGSGANGPVRIVYYRPNGKIIIGGDFTTFNGVARNYIAQLNADGSLDTTYDPGTTLNGPVYAVAPQNGTTINVNAAAGGNELENTNIINVGATSGLLTIDYDMVSIPDDLRVYYGNTNNGVLIYDTGSVSGTSQLVIPFGPTNGVTATVITIVMNQGSGVPGTVWFYNATVQTFAGDQLTIGGDFTSAGGITGLNHVARLLADGSLDTTFMPSGFDGRVRTLATQADAQVIAGGEFVHANGQQVNRIVRLKTDGTSDTDFFSGTGADDIVYNLNIQASGLIYVGGAFTSFNGTHRSGFARLNSDGSIDTSFLDTAYNQFAGLPRIYFADRPGTVLASGVQTNGNVMIGGSFSQVGGGQFDPQIRPFENLNGWPEPKTRDGVRNRYNVARLMGGATPGPGNIGFLNSTYSATKSQGFLFTALTRTNGTLGLASANFAVVPVTAQAEADYDYNSLAPLYTTTWDLSRMHSDGLWGTNTVLRNIFGGYVSQGINGPAAVIVTVNNNVSNPGDLNARFQLANPAGADQFYLGGQNIPLGVALGRSLVPLTLVDDGKKPGTFGFISSLYSGSTNNTPIQVTRTNGTFNTSAILIDYATSAGSNTTNNVDYKDTTGTLTFNDGQSNAVFNVQILRSNSVSSVEKTVNLRLFNIRGNTNAALGLTNAVLRIINPNFQGFLNFTATNYVTNLNAGSISFTVSRTVGSRGTLTVQYATTNGTAINGADYVGATNTLQWNSGDTSPRTVTIPLLNNGIPGSSKDFRAYLFNAQSNNVSAPSLLGSITNTILTISNDNSYGTFQFSASSYVVNEGSNATATVTVIRTGSALGTTTVNFATSNNTAIAGVNYLATNNTLTFTQGQVAASFTVKINNDGVVNGSPFNFYVRLSSPGVGASLGSLTNVPVNIVDSQSFNRPPGSGDVSFDPPDGVNGDVLALALQSSGKIIAGGNFTRMNGTPENHLARLQADGSLDTTFLNGLAGANGPVNAVVSQSDDRILVGGSFNKINNVVRNFIARVNVDGSIDTSFNPGSGANNAVFAVAETFLSGLRKVYVGGSFTILRGSPRLGIGRLNDNGSLDASFAVTGVNGIVYAIAVYPTNSINAGKVLIGGNFTSVNGASQSGIARLNADGSRDTNFSANISGTVRALAIQADGMVLAGGEYLNVNSASVTRIVRLADNGALDAAFVVNSGVGANETVNAIALQADNRILLAGQFTQANGVTRNRITRLLSNGAVDPTINFGNGANNDINAVLVQPADQMIVIGGGFTEFNGQPYPHIARLYGGSVAGSGQFEFTTDAYQESESSFAANITIRRTGGTSGPNPDGSGNVSVNFSTSNGSAAAGVNYTAILTNVVFPPGEVLKTVSVPMIRDNVITSNLTVNLTLANASAPATLGDQTNAVLTIVNADNGISFASDNYIVTKNIPSGNADITIVRLGASNGVSTVDFTTTTNGTALIGTDYTPTNLTVIFNDGETVKTVHIGITNNGLPEGNQTVTMLLSNAIGAPLLSPTNATLTIVDTVNAPGKLMFSTNAYFATEGDGTATITITRTNGTAGTISAFYYTVAGTAVPGVNYLTVSNVISFSDGQTSRTFTVPIVDNSVPQAPVSLLLVLATNNSSGTTLLVPTNASLTISDNDAGFAFATQTNTVRENAGFAVVGVVRVGPTNGTSQVQFTSHDGTAMAGVNYTAANSTLIFDPGQSAKSILVPLINDPRVTGDLIFTMTLSNPSPGAQVVAPSTNVIVLQDADAGLSFTNSAISVFKTSGSAVITVVCSNPSVEPVIVDTNTVPLSVNYTTVNGTATAGVDYLATSGLLIFTNGIGTNTFIVPILNNGQVTGDRAFSVILTNPTAPGKLVAPSNQVVTIRDGTAGFKFSKATYTTVKSAGQAIINVYRVGLTNSLASVVYTATNGTAIAGVHYTPTTGVLVFTNGVTNQTFSVAITDTSTVQPDETVLLQLFSPTNGVLLSPSAATLTIRDNSGSFVVPSGSALVSESGVGAPNGVIDSNETVTVLFAFRDAGGPDVTNLIATLLATNGVTAPSPVSQTYGPLILAGHSVSKPFSFTAQGTNGQQIVATFQLKDGLLNIGTGVFGYILGTRTITFSNTTPIVINDNTAASPYPSSININGLVGSVVKATVTVTNLNHHAPRDIEALVVAPNQANSLLMAHAGGLNAITNVTIKFDDAAATYLPQSTKINSGTNKPTIYTPVSTFAP